MSEISCCVSENIFVLMSYVKRYLDEYIKLFDQHECIISFGNSVFQRNLETDKSHLLYKKGNLPGCP